MAKSRKAKPSKTTSSKDEKKKEVVHNPHDHFFKYTFAQQEHAQEFMETILPTDILDRLLLTKMQLKSGSYIDEKLEEHFSDILYDVPLHTTEPDEPPASILPL